MSRVPIHGNPRNEYPQEAKNRNLRELGLPEQNATAEELLQQVPIIGLLRSLGQGAQIRDRVSDPQLLRNTAGRGLETNYQRGAPFDVIGKDSDMPMMSEGGVVDDESDDPADIPEDIREYVEQAHKAIRESRPDESWRVKPAESPESVAPYKENEDTEDSDKPLITPDMLNFDEGGMVPPQDEGPGPNDPESDGIQPVDPGAIPAPVEPMSEPPPAALAVSRPATPALTDQDFMGRANKMLGLDPVQSASFMKMLGDKSQGAQLGAGLAGVGDAIAAGGTLGKVSPGGLKTSEDLIHGRETAGIEAMQGIREGQKESFGIGQTLRGNEPFSPEIQKSLVTQFHIPSALAGSPRDVIYKMLDPIAQTQLKETELAAQESYKKASIDLQKKQLDATIGNQKAERDIAREGHQLAATEKLGSRTLGNKLEGVIPGTPANTEKKVLERIATGSPAHSFSSVEEAEGAQLPPGTRVSINGRMATIH